MATSRRTLVDRFYAATVPPQWPSAGAVIWTMLRNLQRILGILHEAVEHPAPTAEAKIFQTVDTAITTTSNTDITGATYTFTPDVDMRVVVTANFFVQCSLFGAATHFFTGMLFVNSVGQTGNVVTSTHALSAAHSLAYSWTVPCSAGTAYTFKLTGRTGNVATTYNVRTPNTGFTVTKFPYLYEVP